MIIDQRILRIGIQVSGELRVFDGLAMTASGSKMANDNQNSCTVSITNLSRAVRNYILTETSPFNKNRTPKIITVEAGRVSTGLTRLFVGEITSSSVSQPPDIALELKAKTGEFQKGNVIARTGGAKEKLSALAKNVSDDIGTTLEFEASDKFIANWSFSGAALRQIKQLSEAGGVDVFQDDETLVVKDKGVPRRNVVKIINASSGMIGIPEATERGVRVRTLFDQETQLGGAITVESELNPALNGSYTIYKLDFDLANRNTEWYYDIEASRND
jgi:hypothetical protein